MGAAAMGAATVAAFVKISKEAIKLYNEFAKDELATIQLNTALESSGNFASGAATRFNDFAAAMQATTLYGDDVTKSQIAQLAALGKTEDEIKKIITAAANLASATGVDLDTAVKQLNATLVGNAGYLGRQNAAIRNLTEEELKAGKAIEIVNKQYAGMAEVVGKGALGAMTQFKNAVGDSREALGELVSINFKPLLDHLTEMASSFAKTITEQANLAQVLAGQKNSYADITRAIEAQQEVIKKTSEEELSVLGFEGNRTEEAKRQYYWLLKQQDVARARERVSAEAAKAAKKESDRQEKLLADAKKREEAEKKIAALNEEAIANNPYKSYVEDMAKWRNEQSKIRPEIREFTGELEDQMEATREWPELLSKQDQAWQDYIANLEAATEQYNAQIELADAWQEAFSNAWLGVGEALAEGESGWVAIGEAAKDAFAKILQGLAAELAARSALALLKGQFGKAAAAAAASATTYVAAGAIQAMADGGEGTVTKPTLFLAGEAGPEDFSFVPKSKGGMRGSGNTVVNQYTVYNVGGTLVSERAMKNTVRQMASSRGF